MPVAVTFFKFLRKPAETLVTECKREQFTTANPHVKIVLPFQPMGTGEVARITEGW